MILWSSFYTHAASRGHVKPCKGSTGMKFLNIMQPWPFRLGLFGEPQDAADLHLPLPIGVPLMCWFLPKTACISLTSLMICFSLFFLLLLLLLLHHLFSRGQRRSPPKFLSMADCTNINVSSLETPDQIFILSGQSNMSGRGGIQKKHHKDGSIYKEWDHVVPPECEAENGTICCLNAKLDWVEAREPLHHDIDIGKICGLGPGLVFAASLLRKCKCDGDEPAPSVGLVPCAIGGTQIKEWEKGSKLYEQMIKRARFAMSNSGTLKALLWYQGESDTYSSQNVKEFPQRLDSLIKNIRSDLQNDTLPIIQVGITANKHPYPEFLEEVRCAQMAVNLPGVYYVDAKGLPLLEDNIHLTTHSQVQVGKMLADCYANHVVNQASTLLE